MDSSGSLMDCLLDPSEMAGSNESLSESVGQWECKVLEDSVVLLCRNLQNIGVSLGGESIFRKIGRTSTFEHFTVEPELVHSN